MVLRTTASGVTARPRPTIWMPAIAVLLFTSVYLPLASKAVQFAVPATTVAAAKITPPPVAKPAVASPGAITVSATVNPATCTPLSFGMPTSLDLGSAPAGLTTQIDPATPYRIYGTTAAQLQSQIRRCAPGANGNGGAEFTAQTSYRLNWQYDTTMSGTGCSVTDVRVGLHTAMALPDWQPTPGAAVGLSGRWQQFMGALTTHEEGHVAIDRSYAAKLAADLGGITNTSCNGLSSTVQAVINQDVGALNGANDSYDSRTGHGATQGAVLPTY